MTTLRSQIDHMVGHFDDVQMMLDQENGVPGIDELVQRLQQTFDVGQVQTGRRFIENVDRVLRPLQGAELGGDLDSLSLASR